MHDEAIYKINVGKLVASLVLDRIHKAYGDTVVLDGVSMTLESREFVAFLGPSGSGKSTLLRIVAGLETADAGTVTLDGRRIDQLPPGSRDVAMVFQHYALYPHMSVRENMAFGLRNAGVGSAEIAHRIESAAAVLEISEQLDKKPGQMSGGQRQRVAIGRAIVKHPKLFLLDEPLSNLDAALRTRTRVELAQLRQRVDAAVIMVTHDQAEAMTLADRIVVINDRAIQQVGSPMEVYTKPANAFVAQFVGSPPMTLVPATLVSGSGPFVRVRLGDGAELDTCVPRTGLSGEERLQLGARPENVAVVASGSGTTDAEVQLVERMGDRTLVYAVLADGSEFTAQDEGSSAVRIGDRVGLRIDGTAVHLFGSDGAAHHSAQQP